jgi:hypothetical protein
MEHHRGRFVLRPSKAWPASTSRHDLFLPVRDRSATGKPLHATVTADGTPTDLTFGFLNDAAVTAVAPDFVRRLMNSRAASVLVKDYNAPDPDVVTMNGAAKAIPSALQRCLR